MNARKMERFVRDIAKADMGMMGWPEKCAYLEACVRQAREMVVQSRRRPSTKKGGAP